MSTIDASSGLVVPIKLSALCVGEIDENNDLGTSTFAGGTTIFTEQTRENDAFLGSNVVIPYSAAPWNQLDQGIHVHWSLPKALTLGTVDESGELAFPAICNRWLVSRLVVESDGTVDRKSWVIESDYLTDSIPEGNKGITLPITPVQEGGQPYQYVGKNSPLDEGWSDPQNNGVFKERVGSELNTVISGDIGFAAFYPNCMNILGFHDTLSDLMVPVNGTLDISYQVSGWFSDLTNDPLSAGLTLDEIKSTLGWTFDDPDSSIVDHTLLSASIQSIQWSPNETYVVNKWQQKPIEASLSVGNNPQETFSAYFKDLLHPENDFFEVMLNALQDGVINSFKQPNPNQLARIDELLQQKRFATHDTGSIFVIVSEDQSGTEKTVLDLPLALAENLNVLNISQQDLDFYNAYIFDYQENMFSNWYRLMKTDDPDMQNDIYSLLYNEIGREWPGIAKKQQELESQLTDQFNKTKTQVDSLGGNARLKSTSSSRYWGSNEPVITLSGEEINKTYSFIDVGRYLPCRLDSQLLTGTSVSGTNISSSNFPNVALPNGNNLPYSVSFGELLYESCFLNTSAISGITGVSAAELKKGLQLALNGEDQSVYTFTGSLPFTWCVVWWESNPWEPMFMEWTVNFVPLFDTNPNHSLQDYPSNFFTSNYSVDPDTGGNITYVGSLDPSTIDFSNAQKYTGSRVISNSAAEGLKKQLSDYLDDKTDATLEQILDDLNSNIYLSQSLSGINDVLIMQDQTLQLNVAVGEDNPYGDITNALSGITGGKFAVAPNPNGFFNPIRAGFYQIEFTLLDKYGQKRTVELDKTICADSVTTKFNGNVIPDVIYAPARISQSSRLLFRWLSATGPLYQEMNAHPVTTPICGWIMPNHLDGSMFFYNQLGHALGTMFLNGNQSEIMWQSAPGDNETVNQTVEEIFAYQNENLKGFATALRNGTPEYFKAVWKSIDTMHNFVNPENFAQNVNLEVLVGRPVAITQAIIRLEVNGMTTRNESWDAIKEEKYDSDNGLTQVDFPVVLGNVDKINDGLIGYFLPDNGTYDYTTFYTEGATGKNSGVVKPTPTTIQLTPSAKVTTMEPPQESDGSITVVMLVDPRAEIHATLGILPTKSIDIPSDLYVDVLSTLESTYQVSPLLDGTSGLKLPLPKEEGYSWSWIEEQMVQSQIQWSVDSDIGPAMQDGIYDYSPQNIVEGWLRLNPDLLLFNLLNSDDKPIASGGSTEVLKLLVSNKKKSPIEFTPGQLINEGNPNTGSVIYIHFGTLIDRADVASLVMEAENWDFKSLNDVKYENYWAATPKANVTLENDESLTFTISSAKIADVGGQIQVFYDYYDITGLNDGVNSSLISITSN
ncbi:MAG: hypothetical protein QNK23_13830 [Crocinitomicaceae bacterium]|nr:hypothetical protein [Crocinitomicaceae bacterium]